MLSAQYVTQPFIVSGFSILVSVLPSFMTSIHWPPRPPCASPATNPVPLALQGLAVHARLANLTAISRTTRVPVATGTTRACSFVTYATPSAVHALEYLLTAQAVSADCHFLITPAFVSVGST